MSAKYLQKQRKSDNNLSEKYRNSWQKLHETRQKIQDKSYMKQDKNESTVHFIHEKADFFHLSIHTNK